jgi:hypothetical protein
MWLLRLKNGLELSESEFPWDQVPAGVEIESLALAFPRENAPPYMLEYKGFERYCCTRLSRAGYRVAVQKGGMIFEHAVFPNGMRLHAQAQSRNPIPERYWRRGAEQKKDDRYGQ